MLRSFESVMQHIDATPDYIHPSLEPQPVVGQQVRQYRSPDPAENPLNTWSHCCHLVASQPTSDRLKGRTIVVKDNISVGGLPTTMGTHREIILGGKKSDEAEGDLKLPISPIDATVVGRLISAGAVIKGTSTCENFCASPLSWTSASGPVHHPLLHGYTSGGSSSGSCALVTAHYLKEDDNDRRYGPTVELAIGTDQAGSVRNPACYTGLYGLKPTFGLVPYTGAASMAPMIDHLGPIASSLEDIAAMLQVMAGWDEIDPRMTPESPTVDQVVDYQEMLAEYRASLHSASAQAPSSPNGRGSILKIGLLIESFSAPGVTPEVAELIKQTNRTAFTAAGTSVIEISIPLHTEGPLIWTAATRPSMSQWLSQGRPSGHLSYLPPHIAPQWPPDQAMFELLNTSNPALVNIHLSGALALDNTPESCISSSLETKAHRKVFQLRAAYDAALREVDVLVLPCAPTPSMPHPDPDAGILEKLASAVGLTSNTCPFNDTGHPAMSVPCGTLPVLEPNGRASVRMPVGMQIIGRRWDDTGVLKAAALFEHGKKMM